MTSRTKPDLAPTQEIRIDPDFLPESLRAELLLHLKGSPLTEQQKNSLIVFCNDMTQLPVDTTPFGKQAEQMEVVADNARRLMGTLRNLSNGTRDALNVSARELSSWSEYDPGASPLSQTWELVSALEAAAEHALNELSFDRQTKPSELNASGLVSHIAAYLVRATGRVPPKDRSAWFAAFVGCLGSHLGLKIGPRIVGGGIEAVTR